MEAKMALVENVIPFAVPVGPPRWSGGIEDQVRIIRRHLKIDLGRQIKGARRLMAQPTPDDPAAVAERLSLLAGMWRRYQSDSKALARINRLLRGSQ
jgi:hypothetical protein